MTPSNNATLTLMAGGDIGPVFEPTEQFAELIAPVLKTADLRLGQCERVYSERGTDPQFLYGPGGQHARQHPRMAAVWKAAGIDIVSMASNHSLDWGPEHHAGHSAQVQRGADKPPLGFHFGQPTQAELTEAQHVLDPAVGRLGEPLAATVICSSLISLQLGGHLGGARVLGAIDRKLLFTLPPQGHEGFLEHDSWLTCHEVVGGYNVPEIEALPNCYRAPLTQATVAAVRQVIQGSRLYSETEKETLLIQWPA